MKYTAKINQKQYVADVLILPEGGDISPADLEKIKADAYGKDLLEKGILVIGPAKEKD